MFLILFPWKFNDSVQSVSRLKEPKEQLNNEESRYVGSCSKI